MTERVREASFTVIEALASSLAAAAAHNPNDANKPAAILWTDRDSQWLPIIPQLRRVTPELLTLGEYQPEDRVGPSIWLRCAIDGVLEPPVIPADTTPIVYLPGMGRQELGSAETCPNHLKPLIELQYRGVCWTQKNGRDWTVEAFMVSSHGGLGLDLARDGTTRRSMLRAVGELATAELGALKGRRLEAEDFDRLFSDDLARDALLWLGDVEPVGADWDSARRSAFVSRCRAELGFDPKTNDKFAAAGLLGRREGPWKPVWRRFAESPALYPNVPGLLRRSMPGNLFAEPRSSWPQNNEQDETDLRKALRDMENMPPAAARAKVIELEKEHGPRRGWVWAKLDQAPLANAVEHLAALAEHTSKELGGASVAEMADLYAEGAWQADAAALAGMSAVRSSADTRAVRGALNAIYRPWLESAAFRFQGLADSEPLPGHGQQSQDDASVEPGAAILFADGLRFDVSQRLVERLSAEGWSVASSRRWAGLPTVTATAKPAVSPVADSIEGASPGEDFLPRASDTQRALTTDRFRKLLDGAGYQYLRSDETGDPSGRAWTEDGELDKLGHSLQGKLAARIGEQIALLAERIEALLSAGWNEVRVVTDHGWLWLPGGLPKADLPKYLTMSRWARCASIGQGSTVDAPTVPWHWNPGERVAVAPGIACFGAGKEYAHGGLSLQESLIPILRITAGARSPLASAKITNVSWVGFRCRVRVETAQTGLLADLRTRYGDASSSVTEGARRVEDHGSVSLLVGDDDLEGASATLVVLDERGQMLARQATIIGGES